MAKLSPLRRRMIEDMSVRNLAATTQQSYLHHVARFSRYFGRSPDRLGLAAVHEYQVHLVSQRVSWGGLNQAVCALRFFFGVTLGQPTLPERIPYARLPRRLPAVLSADEVVRFLQAVPGIRNRAALTTAYAAGLRAAEAARLKIADIDSARGVIRVEHGSFGRLRRRQGPLRHAVAAASEYPAGLLEMGASKNLVVSRARRKAPHRSPDLAGRLQGRLGDGRPGQEGHGPYPTS